MFFTRDKIYRKRRRPHHQRPDQFPGMFACPPPQLAPQEVDIALRHAQQGLQQQPFVPGAMQHWQQPQQHQQAQFLQPPFANGAICPCPADMVNFNNNGGHEWNIQELVRRTNLAAALANGIVSPRANYMQLHPMMCADGRFPVDFQVPRTVEGVMLLDNTQLDRILSEYKLHFDTRSLLVSLPPRFRSSLVNTMSPISRFRQAKLQLLLEYLGASRIVEDRARRVGF
ncbi:hypothetical protein AJ79_00674 [Helicocarpus griseus UAMH5409]|uniref:Uncharacterized protein n=1 Tax=Helicocarpus griseus UAMH5409 TaxID=1447875 RepID=A0A2B7YAV1_9EURO|nr:hypothetical protein AJ79_00674 [Helicocarpus griseus UAMH5409]